jgi:hypothetical protein
MSTLKKISSYTTQGTQFYGNIAQMDFNRWGKIEIVFYIGKKTIGVEVAGLVSQRMFQIKPANEKEKKANQEWIERYVLPCYNSRELLCALLDEIIEQNNVEKTLNKICLNN